MADLFGSSEISLIALFWQAHIVVKLVILGLLAASVWCWAIIFEKWVALGRARRNAARFEQLFWSGQSLDELYRSIAHRPQHSMAALFVAAMREWRRSQEASQGPRLTGLHARIEKVMDVAIEKETSRLEGRLIFLASIGSTAPFIGLFGTVWGIMSSFQAIAASKNTNLAVVAPGIAEALFATALGLLAAIPAVIFYNMFVSEIGKIGGRLENFADEFSAILSRQLDDKA